MRPEFEKHWDEIAGFLLEDETSEQEQSGKFKVSSEGGERFDFVLTVHLCLQIEGVWSESYFRSSKVREKSEPA